jgi:signal peptidase I
MNYYALVEELIAEQPVEIQMNGFSMYPTFRAGDWAVVEKCDDATKIRRGDLLAFYAGENNLVCHRIIKIENTDNKLIFTAQGDNNGLADKPFAAEQIFGIIVSYKHKGKDVGVNSLQMKFLRFAFLNFRWFTQKSFRVIKKIIEKF